MRLLALPTLVLLAACSARAAAPGSSPRPPGNSADMEAARARDLAAASDRTPVQFQDDATRDAVARLAGYLPNTRLTSHTGEELRFHDDLVRDRCVLIQFMYTTCDGT